MLGDELPYTLSNTANLAVKLKGLDRTDEAILHHRTTPCSSDTRLSL
jgi:hypothetical protein